MLKSVLLALDGSPASAVAQQVAIRFCAARGAELHGIGVLDTPAITAPESAPVGGSAFKKDRDEALLTDAKERIARFLTAFRLACEEGGVGHEIIEADGNPATTIVGELIKHDLLMIGRDTNFHFETSTDTGETVGRLLRESPRPVVLIPETAPAGSAVVVAYDGSLQAARALQLAVLLGLLRDRRTHIISIAPTGDEAEARCRQAEEYLRRHRSAAELHPLTAESKIPALFLEEASKLKPEMIVMGAFGQSGLRDFFLGSFSRTMIKSCEVPMFIHH